MKKYYVVTENGAFVFSSDSKVECNRYLKQAIAKGSPVGFLRIVKGR